jgi:hypothetical protein
LGPLAKPLATLTQEEVDKDLRHFNAYRTAVLSYRQQYYLAVNRMTAEAIDSSTTPTSSSLLTNLPVRLDPEEEKRLTLLRKKIQRAELHREELEQQYVALRAHYVQTAQELREAHETRNECVSFLQEAVQQRATAVGLMRARLQMTRDVLATLQHRNKVLGINEASAAAPPQQLPDSELENAWSIVDDELKKDKKKKKALLWPCTKQPSTPLHVPIMLSNISTAPEKSLAFGTNQAFGAKPESLCYLTENVPNDDLEEDDTEQVEALAEEASYLQSELDKERALNETLSRDIASARTKNDEWVAMLCLVRQETEAVLFRHNIIMESDPAMRAAEKQYEETLAERAMMQTEAGNNDASTNGETREMNGVSNGGDVVEKRVTRKRVSSQPDDNDGDDEGSEEEEAQPPPSTTSSGRPKRAVEEPPAETTTTTPARKKTRRS